MGQSAKPTRQNRTITVDFQEPSAYLQLIHDGKAFVECVFAFLLSLGFQLTHKATCRGGGCLTRRRDRWLCGKYSAVIATSSSRSKPYCRKTITSSGPATPILPDRMPAQHPPSGSNPTRGATRIAFLWRNSYTTNPSKNTPSARRRARSESQWKRNVPPEIPGRTPRKK